MLQFYQRNPKRSVLVHTRQIKHLARRCLQYLSKHTAAPLTLSGQNTHTADVAPDTAAALLDDAQTTVLASLLLQSRPQVQTVYTQLQAASILAASLPPQNRISLAGANTASMHYRAWQACIGQKQRIQQLDRNAQETLARNSRLQEHIEETRIQLDGQTRKLAAAQAQAQKNAQENDALHAQLQKIGQDLLLHQQKNQEQAHALDAGRLDLQEKEKQLIEIKNKLAQQEKKSASNPLRHKRYKSNCKKKKGNWQMRRKS